MTPSVHLLCGIVLKIYRTPFDIAWDSLHLGGGVAIYQKDLKDLYSDKRQLERCQFSPLHRLILDLTTADLETRLKLSTSGIDVTDRGGRTALSWASERGDTEAVRTLLQYGATPNTVDVLGMSPLHYSYLYSRNEALIRWGGDADGWMKSTELSALYVTVGARSLKDNNIAQLLLQHGAGATPATEEYETKQGYIATCLADHEFLSFLIDKWLQDCMKGQEKHRPTAMELLQMRWDLDIELLAPFQRVLHTLNNLRQVQEWERMEDDRLSNYEDETLEYVELDSS